MSRRRREGGEGRARQVEPIADTQLSYEIYIEHCRNHKNLHVRVFVCSEVVCTMLLYTYAILLVAHFGGRQCVPRPEIQNRFSIVGFINHSKGFPVKSSS